MEKEDARTRVFYERGCQEGEGERPMLSEADVVYSSDAVRARMSLRSGVSCGSWVEGTLL